MNPAIIRLRRGALVAVLAQTVVLGAPVTAASAAAPPNTPVPANTPSPKDYPSRPIRMVNPYAPGGTVDIVARTVSTRVSEAWGQQVIVDNRPGGNTIIGTDIVAKAQGDGYTLLTNSSTIAVNPAITKKLPYDTLRDLIPVVPVTVTPNVLALHPAFPAKTVRELVDLARASPGQIAFASSGTGGSTFFALALFRHVAKIDLLHVPYKGGGPAVTDVIGGQVKGIFNPPGGVMQHVRAGRLRALAVTSAKRSEVAPELPTIAELGYPGYEAVVWYGIYAPRGTPRAIVEKWNAEVNRILATPETRERFLAVGMVPLGGDTTSFEAYFREDIARWTRLVRETGMNLE